MRSAAGSPSRFPSSRYRPPTSMSSDVMSSWQVYHLTCCENLYVLMLITSYFPQPGPREQPVQCFVRRDRATSTYLLYLGLSPCKLSCLAVDLVFLFLTLLVLMCLCAKELFSYVYLALVLICKNTPDSCPRNANLFVFANEVSSMVYSFS